MDALFLMQNVHIFYLLPYCIHIVAQFVMLEGIAWLQRSPRYPKSRNTGMWRWAKFRLLTSCFAGVMAERLNFQLNYTDFFQLRKYIDSTLSRCCRFLSKDGPGTWISLNFHGFLDPTMADFFGSKSLSTVECQRPWCHSLRASPVSSYPFNA